MRIAGFYVLGAHYCSRSSCDWKNLALAGNSGMYYDLLPKIKNAALARKEGFQAPFSKTDLAIAKVLVDEGYLKSAEKKSIGKKNVIDVKLRYHDGRPALSDFKTVSKPGGRFYIGYQDLKPIKQNYGIAVLSTPQGVMTNKEARKKKVGGAYLFEVW